MADKISENSGSLEERKQATKDLFERDIAPDVNRKDLDADNVLGSDYHEVAQSDVAMPGSSIEDDKEVNEKRGISDQVDIDGSVNILSEIDQSDTPAQATKSQSSSEFQDVDITVERTGSISAPTEQSAEQRAYTTTSVHDNPEQLNIETYNQSDIFPVPPNIETDDISYQIPVDQPQDTKITDDEKSTVDPAVESHGDMVIAHLYAGDAESDANYSFQLVGQGNDLFEIVDSRLLVKEGVDFDLALNASHTLVIQVTDSSGNSHQESVVINIDDATGEPVLRLSAPVDEIEPTEESQGPSVPEPQPAPEELTYALADNEIAPAGFVLNDDGSYSFDSTHEAYQHLGIGDTQTLNIPVTVTNELGVTSNIEIQVTVTGTNDLPVTEIVTSDSVSEGDTIIAGQVTATDIDDNSILTFTLSDGIDSPPGFVINEDGKYSFDTSSYNGLSDGELQIIEIPISVTDEHGGTAETILNITVTGTNDTPIAVAQEVLADQGELITGQLEASDVDLADGEALIFSTESEVEGLTLNEDGSYSFDASSYEELGAGETETFEVPITVTDDQGAIAETTLTLTVTGTNDTPVARAEETAVDEGSVVTGQLEASDVDLAEDSSLTFKHISRCRRSRSKCGWFIQL